MSCTTRPGDIYAGIAGVSVTMCVQGPEAERTTGKYERSRFDRNVAVSKVGQ